MTVSDPQCFLWYFQALAHSYPRPCVHLPEQQSAGAPTPACLIVFSGRYGLYIRSLCFGNTHVSDTAHVIVNHPDISLRSKDRRILRRIAAFGIAALCSRTMDIHQPSIHHPLGLSKRNVYRASIGISSVQMRRTAPEIRILFLPVQILNCRYLKHTATDTDGDGFDDEIMISYNANGQTDSDTIDVYCQCLDGAGRVICRLCEVPADADPLKVYEQINEFNLNLTNGRWLYNEQDGYVYYTQDVYLVDEASFGAYAFSCMDTAASYVYSFYGRFTSAIQ